MIRDTILRERETLFISYNLRRTSTIQRQYNQFKDRTNISRY